MSPENTEKGLCPPPRGSARPPERSRMGRDSPPRALRSEGSASEDKHDVTLRLTLRWFTRGAIFYRCPTV